MNKEPNSLAIALAQSKNTFVKYREFLVSKGFNREQILSIEYGNIDIYIPRCIKFIESLNIDFNEAVNYYIYDVKYSNYWELITIVIVGVFRKIENNDINFNPF